MLNISHIALSISSVLFSSSLPLERQRSTLSNTTLLRLTYGNLSIDDAYFSASVRPTDITTTLN